MGRWRLPGVVIAGLLTLASLAAPAGALEPVTETVTPFTISPTGSMPNVTVDAAGTAYVAWDEPFDPAANRAQVMFCRLPRGATACSPLTPVNPPGDSGSLPVAFANGGLIYVISYRYGLTGPSFSATLLFTSSDGGASFDAGTSVGAVAPHDYAPGPGAGVSTIDSATSCGSCFQRMPLDGSPVTGPTSLSPDHPYLGVVALIDANTPLAVFAAGNGDGQARHYSGSGDVNDAANWTPAVDIGTLDTPHLVSGPSGVFLISQDALSSSRMTARRFDGNGFGPATEITTGARADHVAEDSLGRTHLIASSYAGPTGSLVYASSDNGTAWEKRTIGFPALPGDMRLSMAGDHRGFVVGRYILGQTGLWAAAIGPSAAVPTTGKFVNATVVSGTVLIQVPPSKTFVPLRTGDVIPVGSLVDTTKGRVRITIALPDGTLQATDFFSGVFKVTQAKTGLATMVLSGGSFKKCGRAARTVFDAKAKVIRHLWGEGDGKFRTKGRFAAASIRGTTWDTIDRCDGTLVRVTKGRVVVTDLKRHKTVTLKAGQSYLAKA